MKTLTPDVLARAKALTLRAWSHEEKPYLYEGPNDPDRMALPGQVCLLTALAQALTGREVCLHRELREAFRDLDDRSRGALFRAAQAAFERHGRACCRTSKHGDMTTELHNLFAKGPENVGRVMIGVNDYVLPSAEEAGAFLDDVLAHYEATGT